MDHEISPSDPNEIVVSNIDFEYDEGRGRSNRTLHNPEVLQSFFTANPELNHKFKIKTLQDVFCEFKQVLEKDPRGIYPINFEVDSSIQPGGIYLPYPIVFPYENKM
jgi:hypothetical protein